MAPHPQRLTVTRRAWPLARPLVTAHGVKTTIDVVVAEISDVESRGRGEGVPLGRYGESIDSVVAAVDAMKGAVFSGLNRDTLQHAMPPGAARNALDCAFWDMDAKRAYRSVAELAGLGAAPPLMTALTIAFDTPDKMAELAAANRTRPLLKLELGGDGDVERVRAVRHAAPAARLIVDANEGWNERQLRDYLPMLVDLRVELIEQPLPAGADDALARLERLIPLCAGRILPDACRSRPARWKIPGHQYQARQSGWADRGARAGGGSEAAGLADHGRWRDQHVAWDRAGAARRTSGRDRRSRRTTAIGARSRVGAAVRRRHDTSARSDTLGRTRLISDHELIRI